MNTNSSKAWDGRFSKAPDSDFEAMSRSLHFDARLYLAECHLSSAYAKALEKVGVLSSSERASIVQGLQDLHQEIGRGEAKFLSSDEDIHMAMERLLSEKIGSAGEKIHSGRSRNDQVATSFRLYLTALEGKICRQLVELMETLLQKALQHVDHLLPGYTHLQQAQPVSLAHYLLSFFWAFARDVERMFDSLPRLLTLPLGSGAMAGSGFKLDRQMLAKELGFLRVAKNSMDSVSDRDFALEFLFMTSLVSLHVSRLAEDWIIFSSSEFSFIQMADEYSTGSSIMPNKKNPDSLELSRGKIGRVIGSLISLVVTLKGLPSTYNRDLQEDKEPVFDAADTMTAVIPVVTGVVKTVQFNVPKIEKSMDSLLLATELADFLTCRSLPFRQAHKICGKIVKYAQEKKRNLDQLTLEELHGFSPLFDQEIFSWLDFKAAVKRREIEGGTGGDALARQIDHCQQVLQQYKSNLTHNFSQFETYL